MSRGASRDERLLGLESELGSGSLKTEFRHQLPHDREFLLVALDILTEAMRLGLGLGLGLELGLISFRRVSFVTPAALRLFTLPSSLSITSHAG